MRGRKPTPTQLKVIKGTDRADRFNPREPTPDAARPAPPQHLSEEATVEWARVSDELHTLGLISNLDRAALGAYCQAYGRWVQAERALARMAARDLAASGLMIKTQSGNAIQNPLVGAANKAMADMMRYAAEFGMTPSARSRIAVGEGDAEGELAKKYFG